MGKKSGGLSRKIIIYTAAIALVTIVLFTAVSTITLITFKRYVVTKTENEFKINANRNLEREVISYSKILNSKIESQKDIAYLFGNLLEGEVIKFMRNREKRCYEDQLKPLFATAEIVLDLRSIMILNSDFRAVCIYPKSFTVDLNRILKNNKDRLRTIRNNKVTFIDFHINADNSVSYGYIFSIVENKRNIGYILFDINPEKVYSLIKTAQLHPYSQKYLWVINKKGTLIFDPQTIEHPQITLLDNVNLTDKSNGEALSLIVENDILKGKTGTSRYKFRNVDKFVGYTYLKEPGWGLGLTLPTNDLYAPLNRLSKEIDLGTLYALSAIGVLSAMVILMSITASLIGSRKVVKPILYDVDIINAIIKGDAKRRLPTGSNDELDDLARSINKLVELFVRIKEKLKE